jgi:hypothetical protein
MPAIIAALIGGLPTLIDAIQKLIARGRVTGELTPAEADALTALAQAEFAKYSMPAPPPPGA